MYELISNNSIYLAVLAGLIAGVPLIMSVEKTASDRRLLPSVLLAVLFSAVSVFSVLLFASFEKLISGGGLSIGAVSTYGVYLIAPLILLLVIRKDRALRFDQFAIFVLPSLFLQRIRCLFIGCCYGKTIHGMEMRWPTREAELVFYAVMLILFLYLEKKGNVKEGGLFPLLMICYGAFRFIAEFFRDNGSGLFHLAHIWSIIALIIGVCLYTELSAARTGGKKVTKKRGKK